MIYMALASLREAKPIIEHIGAKRNNIYTKIQVYDADGTTVIITGIGILDASVALTYVLSQKKIRPDDIFVNIGICAGTKGYNVGDIVICNKIIDHITHKGYYPDMIYVHPFRECSIECCMKPIEGHDIEEITCDTVDMESYGLFKSGRLFFSSDKMFFVKIISDDLVENKADVIGKIDGLIRSNMLSILEWLYSIAMTIKDIYNSNIFNDEEINKINELGDKLKLSVTLKYELLNIMKYYKLDKRNILDIMQDILNKVDENKLEKKEGKDIVGMLKKKIIKQ